MGLILTNWIQICSFAIDYGVFTAPMHDLLADQTRLLHGYVASVVSIGTAAIRGFKAKPGVACPRSRHLVLMIARTTREGHAASWSHHRPCRARRLGYHTGIVARRDSVRAWPWPP
jgi:hypothetical protein